MKTSEKQTLIDCAWLWSKRSHCKRLQVGAVIAKNGRILSTGYNGAVTGADNNCECKEGKTIPGIIHAEANAILWAAKEGISTNDCSIFITHSPCIECAKLIIQSGITSVYYSEYYRDNAGIDFLEANNIIPVKLNY
jgi:dCMP deaminase